MNRWTDSDHQEAPPRRRNWHGHETRKQVNTFQILVISENNSKRLPLRFFLFCHTCNLENWESLISQSLFRSMVCISQKYVFSKSQMLRFEADVGANWRLGRLEWGMSAGKYLNQRHHNYRLIKSTPPKAKGKIKSQQLQPSTWGSICWFWDTIWVSIW